MKCSGKNKSTIDEFINKANKIHNNKYSYNNCNYINAKTEILITCDNHGDFYQTPNAHLSGKGCSQCSHTISKPSQLWLNQLNIPKNYREIKLKLNGILYKLDAYDPINKIVYEFNGDFWHGNPELYGLNDINPIAKKTFGELYRKTLEKKENLERHGFKVISIWESEFRRNNGS